MPLLSVGSSKPVPTTPAQILDQHISVFFRAECGSGSIGPQVLNSCALRGVSTVEKKSGGAIVNVVTQGVTAGPFDNRRFNW
jgi:hypothetical protein